MRQVLLMMTLAACADEAPLVLVDAAGPPPVLVLPRAMPGHRAIFEVADALPGERVWLVRGSSVGAGPCPAALAGACLGVRQPVVLTSAVTDISGLARLTVTAPASAPVGARLLVQAATASGGVTAPAWLTLVHDPHAALSTGFDTPADLADWRILSDEEGSPTLHDSIGITGDALRIVPDALSDASVNPYGTGPGWFEDAKGPFVFRDIDGDFAARLRVTVTTPTGGPPTSDFNAAGFVLRDPASFDPSLTPDVGDERWIMYNIGRQAGVLATELKTTFPDGPDANPWSQSSLFLEPASSFEVELLLCRVDHHIRAWRRVQGESGWTPEDPRTDTLYHDGAGVGAAPLTAGFDRPDLGSTLQIGFMVGRWDVGTPVVGLAHELHFGLPADLDDCLAAPVAD